MNYHIGEYEVKTSTHELLHNSSPQIVEPLIFKLLVFMLKNPNRLLTRDELIKSIWNSRIISDSALNASISNARKAIGDNAKNQCCIKTVSGSGYRFIAEFTSSLNEEETSNKINIKLPAKQTEGTLNTFILPDKPSLAVMDFVNQKSSEKGQLYTDAITVEITSGLARLNNLFVIARPSASNLSQLKLLPNDISQHLGVRYLVYGTTIISSNRMSITITIVDAIANTEIWSEHFSHTLDDIWLIQEKIIQTIVTSIDSKIERAEIERAFLITSENLSAWENYHRGIWHMDKTTLKDIDTAQHYFQNAVLEDSRFARAHAGISYTLTSRCLLQHTKIKKININIIKSIEYARRSIDYCPKEVMGLVSLVRAKVFSNQVLQAIPIIDQTINHCSNSSILFLFKALAHVRLEDTDTALKAIENAEHLNPYSPMSDVSLNLARAMIMCSKQNYLEAVTYSVSASHLNDSYYLSHALAAGCLQLAEDEKRAQQYASQALKILPQCTVESCERTFPLNKKSREIFVNALIAAGIPKSL